MLLDDPFDHGSFRGSNQEFRSYVAHDVAGAQLVMIHQAEPAESALCQQQSKLTPDRAGPEYHGLFGCQDGRVGASADQQGFAVSGCRLEDCPMSFVIHKAQLEYNGIASPISLPDQRSDSEWPFASPCGASDAAIERTHLGRRKRSAKLGQVSWRCRQGTPVEPSANEIPA
jgi:hypothetical protein